MNENNNSQKNPLELALEAFQKGTEKIEKTRTDLEEVKTNVYLRVRLAFDPPQNSFLVTSIKEQIVESTWYIELYHKENTTVGGGETTNGE